MHLAVGIYQVSAVALLAPDDGLGRQREMLTATIEKLKEADELIRDRITQLVRAPRPPSVCNCMLRG